MDPSPSDDVIIAVYNLSLTNLQYEDIPLIILVPFKKSDCVINS